MSKINKNLKFYIVLSFFILSFFTNFNKAFATTLNFSPTIGTYNVGDFININVSVSSDSSINAVSGNVIFSSDTLSIVFISKNSSIINLWPHDPYFSNETSSASFEGVVLDGYRGDAGNIVTIVFQAKKAGVAVIKFTNISILANDGKGTDVFSGDLSSRVLSIENVTQNENIQSANGCINGCVDQKAFGIKNSFSESAIAYFAMNATEKIKEIEISNHLINNSLLITTIIIFVIILAFILIFFFLLIFRLKKYFKNKLIIMESIISKHFKKLEKNVDQKIMDPKNTENDRINIDKANGVVKEVINTEEEIIKEVEKIKKDL